MTTLTIQIPDNQAKILIDFVEKLGGRAIDEDKLMKMQQLANEINAGIVEGKTLSLDEIVKESYNVRSKNK